MRGLLYFKNEIYKVYDLYIKHTANTIVLDSIKCWYKNGHITKDEALMLKKENDSTFINVTVKEETKKLIKDEEFIKKLEA